MQNVLTQVPDDTGHFGPYGGMFVPETLMAPLHELTVEYELAVADPDFRNELKNLLEEYAGRPTPLYFAGRMTERIIRGTALASYSIYLVHVLIMADLHTLLSGWPRGAAKSAFILSVTLVVCIMFYFAVEKPSIVTRDMFLQRKKRLAAKAPQML